MNLSLQLSLFSFKTIHPFLLLHRLLLLVSCCGLLTTLEAQTNNDWSAGANGNWNVNGNWSLGHFPTQDETARILTNFEVTIPAGFAATSAATEVINGSLTIAATGSLTVTVDGDTEEKAAGICVDGNGSFINNGTFTVNANNSDGGYGISLDDGSITNTGVIVLNNTNDGGILVDNNETFNNNSGGSVTITSGRGNGITVGGTFNNSGSINISESFFDAILVDGTFNNNSGGSVTITSPRADGIDGSYSYSTFNNYGTVSISNVVLGDHAIEGKMDFNNLYGGVVMVNDADSFISSADFFHSAGSTIAPGTSPGTMVFSSAEDFSNATIAIELAGAGTAGTDYDLLAVNGAATFSSTTINVSFINGFIPSVNDAFAFMTFTSTSGTLSFNLPAGYTWDTAINGTNITITMLTILPVELLDFRAEPRDNGLMLEWQTASETNNRGFEIERSADGRYWENLAFVDGQGDSFEKISYSWLDRHPLPGSSYYRLQQIDFDGQSEYSPVVSVQRSTDGLSAIKVYPNPVSNGQLNLYFPEDFDETSTLELYNLAGQMLTQQAVGEMAGVLDVSVLPAGVYFLNVTAPRGASDHEVWRERLVVQ